MNIPISLSEGLKETKVRKRKASNDEPVDCRRVIIFIELEGDNDFFAADSDFTGGIVNSFGKVLSFQNGRQVEGYSPSAEMLRAEANRKNVLSRPRLALLIALIHFFVK